MPEGDTVYRTAVHLNTALAGRVLTVCDLRVPKYASVDLSGETVDEVVSVGKHLLTRVGGYSIHSHLKMEGSWHVYRHGTKWRRPAFQARAVLENTEWVTVGFDLGTLEVVERDREDEVVGYLGPDLLGPGWDAGSVDEAVRRLGEDGEREIDVALLDQRNLAGLGNVFVNELCFLRGLLPQRPVAESGDLVSIVELGHRLITANRDRVERTTTGDTRPGRQTWVYGREGRPCLRCGTRIRRGALGANELSERVTYWCPRCQT
ncbi:Fpg/Nei family DNA glycosylase [Herbiconiux sp. KACC 21604]|uniref:Fpg/Nei family DNA glycosylase n=1 Tax=unclassified Herbiconiux TaxID=2618217 RepID=UPI001490B02B|nr:Fpg/Nei family DNA glycosylase [Herbiconiux sp. SALV-R1]QJU52375.1 Fpg/Nei family DNA glycosylase [Herbiconiux sp. SALV-R1]WPO87233.1 Fpg/Nei family DNA glycosylase [Herbiconiux sp. KACC 21604]